jgi:chromosome segregation ATPase
MTDITELESRLSAALDRIGQGLDLIENAGSRGDDGALGAELDAQQQANVELEDRLKALREEQDNRLAAFEARIEAQNAQMAELDGQLQALRHSNAELREVAGELREAMEAELADPKLIDRAMAAELEALRAERDAEVAELGAVLSELKPLVEERE